VLPVVIGACSSGTTTPTVQFDKLFPTAKEIGSWDIPATWTDTQGSPHTNAAGVEQATDKNGLVAIINGGADVYINKGFKKFGREYYNDGTYTLCLWVFEFPDAAVATSLYNDLVNDALYTCDWKTETLGEAGRVCDTGLHWNIHARKGKYFIAGTQVKNEPAGKTAALTLLNGVLAKM
jgi:hypothetical protein